MAGRKWEYKVLARTNQSDAEDEHLLNELGEKGWRLVTVITSVLSPERRYFFEREKTS